MVQIIAAFDNYKEAQEIVNRLIASGYPKNIFSIHDNSSSPRLASLMKLIIVSGVGLMAAYLVPNFGITHLAVSPIIQLIGLMSIRLVAGVATGSAVDFLFRVAATPNTEDLLSDRFVVTLESDWQTAQKVQHEIKNWYTFENERLEKIVNKFGYEHQSFLSLYEGAEVWFSDRIEAAVVYRRVGRVAVVTAAPMAAREHWKIATSSFLDFCLQQNLDCLMLPVSQEFAHVAQECGMGLQKIGESGYFKLPEWKPAGDRGKKVRAGINQSRKAGITVVPFDASAELNHHNRHEIEQLCQQWINTREVDALGWLMELNPFKLSEYKKYFLARNAEGRLEGMLACSPFQARRGWYLEDLIRRPDAERGVSELLVVEAMQHLAAEGAELATLGTSPLAGIKVEGQFKLTSAILGFIYRNFDSFYHFKQLHRFKAKFAPTFVDPEFIAVWPARFRFRMVHAAICVLDPKGLIGMTKAKIQKMWQAIQIRGKSGSDTEFEGTIETVSEGKENI